MGARFLSSTGLGFDNLTERVQFFPVPALDKNRSPEGNTHRHTIGNRIVTVHKLFRENEFWITVAVLDLLRINKCYSCSTGWYSQRTRITHTALQLITVTVLKVGGVTPPLRKYFRLFSCLWISFVGITWKSVTWLPEVISGSQYPWDYQTVWPGLSAVWGDVNWANEKGLPEISAKRLEL